MFKGHKHTEEAKRKISESKLGAKLPYVPHLKHRGHTPWNKGKKCPYLLGENHWNWKGGILPKDSLRKRRHTNGVNKRYNLGTSLSKDYKKLKRKQYKALKKNGGPLPLKTIQLVYEDNIKKYGTLTCYLCLEPILFGRDHLEHKTPLSRGGTNEYNNLGVACQKCNCKKHAKTEEEYRKENKL